MLQERSKSCLTCFITLWFTSKSVNSSHISSWSLMTASWKDWRDTARGASYYQPSCCTSSWPTRRSLVYSNGSGTDVDHSWLKITPTETLRWRRWGVMMCFIKGTQLTCYYVARSSNSFRNHCQHLPTSEMGGTLSDNFCNFLNWQFDICTHFHAIKVWPSLPYSFLRQYFISLISILWTHLRKT